MTRFNSPEQFLGFLINSNQIIHLIRIHLYILIRVQQSKGQGEGNYKWRNLPDFCHILCNIIMNKFKSTHEMVYSGSNYKSLKQHTIIRHYWLPKMITNKCKFFKTIILWVYSYTCIFHRFNIHIMGFISSNSNIVDQLINMISL